MIHLETNVKTVKTEVVGDVLTFWCKLLRFFSILSIIHTMLICFHVSVQPDIGWCCMCHSCKWRLCASSQSSATGSSDHWTGCVHWLFQYI